MESITHHHIQNKWKNGFLPGIDCIVFKNGKIVIANTYRVTDSSTNKSKQYWSPLCDTTISSLEHYCDDIWTNVDIYHGSINYRNEKIVFGDGSMGNEGFVASLDQNNNLNWGIFFTFSNPIMSAEIENDTLICISELETKISIQLNDLTKISIETKY